MMNRHILRTLALAAVLILGAGACGGDEEAADTTESEPAAVETEASEMETEMMESETEEMASEMDSESEMESESEMATDMDSAEACDADAIVELVEGGPEAGTIEGMTTDPVGTAASNNPVLTTLTMAATEAGLVDTLNSAEALTVFAPTDCAFAAADPATVEAALADPTGLLTEVLGFHVVPGEQLAAADLEGMTELETFTGAILPIEVDGETVTLNDGQATVVVPDIQTANATVHLIDNLMVPADAGSASEAPSEAGSEAAAAGAAGDPAAACDADAIVAAVEGGENAEGTIAGMTDDPVGTAASNNPVLTTLTSAATEANLVDTLNTAEALTVFAPTDCAFAAADPATIEAALADPTGLLTQVLGFHVVAGERLSAADLAGRTELETFTGATLQLAPEGEALSLNGGQATVVVPDIQTANATVHLIDNVMVPAS